MEPTLGETMLQMQLLRQDYENSIKENNLAWQGVGDLAKRAQAEVRRLRNLIREFSAQDESFEVREALRKAVE